MGHDIKEEGRSLTKLGLDGMTVDRRKTRSTLGCTKYVVLLVDWLWLTSFGRRVLA